MGYHSDSYIMDKPKRLTILVTSTQRRGAEVFGERLASGLPSRGWSVDFVALGRAADSNSAVTAEPLSPVPVGRLDISVVRRLRTRLSQSQPDVVLANGSSTLHYGVMATRTLLRRPRLAYSSIGEPRYWADSPRRRLTYRAFLAFVDRVFSVSHPTAAQLTEQFGISERRIRVLPTGVPDELYSVERNPHEPPLRILYMGSLSHEKNPLAAVKILANLVPDTPAVMRMVGEGPLRHEIESAALATNVGHALELVGSVEDVRPHLAWADVLLLTSRTEGLPAATLEAAATGIPSVAFDVGGVAETIHDGATGRLITSGDVTNAALALATYAADLDTRLAHGQAARAMAESTFTVDLAIARYDRALRELVSGDHKA